MKADIEAIAAGLIASARRETRKAGTYLQRRAEGLTRYADAMTADIEALTAAPRQ